MTIYRAYSQHRKSEDRFLLAHGYIRQRAYTLFDSIHLISPLTPGRFGWLRQILYVLKAKRWLKTHQHEFDVFFALSAYHADVMPALYASKALGKPAFVRVATAHSDLASKKRGAFSWVDLAKKRREALRSLNGVFAISREIVDELREYGLEERKILYVPNGVDTRRFQPAPPERKKAARDTLGIGSQYVFLFCGALVRKKQPHLAIEGLAHCVSQGYDASLLLVGPSKEPEYRRELDQLIQKHDLQDRVIISSFSDQPELYYAAADAFLLPSQREGMSNAMLEASSSGLPVIVGKVSGARELLEEFQAGDIIDVSSSLALKEIMSGYCADPVAASKKGENARRAVLEKFSSEMVYQKHMEIFRKSMWHGNSQRRVP